MQPLDHAVIGVYFIISLGIAFYFSRRSGRSTEDFFGSGKSLPWWIAGTTMVATTFAADTPLAVTELVSKNGIAGNWLWWNMIAGNVLTVFFFARLWRRAGILTDVEFIELRYSGRPAAFLRGFKAVYLGVFMNSIIMGWVNVALAEILKIVFNAPEDTVLIYVFSTMLVVGVYSAMTGLSGISYADSFQFITAMTGCIILAAVVLGLPEVGGIEGLKRSLPAGTFNFFSGNNYSRRGGRRGNNGYLFFSLYRPYRNPMVGFVVSGLRARRRGLRGAKDDSIQNREGFAARGPLVYCRPLRAEAVAVDHHRARGARAVSRAEGGCR